MMSCPSLQSLAAWVTGDTSGEEDASLEAHLFDCDRCARRAAGVELVVRRLREMLPPLLTPERRRRVEESVHPRTVPVAPGQRATLEFEPGVQTGLWIMQADLHGVDRLDCELVAPDGSVLTTMEDIPFDTERGEVVLGCQTHYRLLGYPDEIMARVTAVDAAGRHPVGEYFLNHVFADV